MAANRRTLQVTELVIGLAGLTSLLLVDNWPTRLVGLFAALVVLVLLIRDVVLSWWRRRLLTNATRTVEVSLAPLVHIYQALDEEPDLVSKSETSTYSSSDDEQSLRHYESNEGVAVADRGSLQTELSVSHPLVRVRELPFVELRRLRDEAGSRDELPLTVSAITLAVDSETRSVILQCRAEDSYVYRGLLGAPGGLVRTLRPLSLRDYSFQGALEREFTEEIGEGSLEMLAPWIVSEDVQGGFLQVGPMISVWRSRRSPNPPGIEGRPVALGFDELRDKIQVPTEWTPGTYLRLMLWLALGAPEGSSPVRRESKQLFDLSLQSVAVEGLFVGSVFNP